MRAPWLVLLLLLTVASAAAPLRPFRTVAVAQVGQAPLALDDAGDLLGVEQGSVRLRTSSGRQQQDFGPLSAKFSPSAVALSPDGRTAIGLAGGQGFAWETRSARPLWSLSASLACFTPDGAVLTLEGPILKLRKAQSGRVVWQRSLPAPTASAPAGLDVSPDGRRVVVLLGGQVTRLESRSGRVLWRVNLSKEQGAGYQGQDIAPSALAFSRDGQSLYTATARHVYRLDADRGRVLASVPLSGPVQALATTARGVAVAAGADIALFNPVTLRPTLTLHGHAAPVLSLAISRDGSTLWSADLTVTKRWNLRTLAFRTYGRIQAAALSPDGHTLALALGDTTIRLQDAQMGAWKKTLVGFDPPQLGTGHEPGNLRLLFSPDGHVLAAGTSQVWFGVPKARPDPGTLRLYRVTMGRLLQTWDQIPVYRLAFRSDSSAVMASAQGLHAFQFSAALGTPGLSGGFGTPEGNVGQSVPMFVRSRSATLGVAKRADGLHATIWVGQLYRVLEGRVTDAGTTLRASPGGQTVAAQGKDGLRIWDVASGKVRFVLPDEAALPIGEAPLVFSPDGHFLAGTFCPGGKPGCGSGAKLRVWDTRKGEVASTVQAWAPPIAVENGGRVWTLEDGQLKGWQPE